jgi:amino acid transporter
MEQQPAKSYGLFPGWGKTRVIATKLTQKHDLLVVADTDSPVPIDYSKADEGASGTNQEHQAHTQAKISTLSSVSIAGNDLMSSCLYTAGVCVVKAGKLAPISLLLVTWMLFYFRKVDCEAVTAIPINGGTYNIALNITNKKVASFIACLSVLSYTATAIISAFDSSIYLSMLWDGAGESDRIILSFAVI